MSFAFGIGIGTQNNQGEWLEVECRPHTLLSCGARAAWSIPVALV